MKAAVGPSGAAHGEEPRRLNRGKIVLATVKGDVHDIGKNLVEIILTNNGFQVVNLGIKVPPEELIKAVREHQPDIDRPVGPAGEIARSRWWSRRRTSRRRAYGARCWWAARRYRRGSHGSRLRRNTQAPWPTRTTR